MKVKIWYDQFGTILAINDYYHRETMDDISWDSFEVTHGFGFTKT